MRALDTVTMTANALMHKNLVPQHTLALFKSKDSLKAILKACKILDRGSVERVVICFDNKQSKAYLKRLKKQIGGKK